MRVSVALLIFVITLGSAVVGGGMILFRTHHQPQDRELPALSRMLPEDRPLRLAVFGTSLSAHGYDWPEAVALALGTCLGQAVELIRFALPGAGSEWGVTQVPWVRESAPDLVLLEFAINDADLRDGLFRSAARDTHERLLTALQQELPQSHLVLMTMNPAQGLRGWIRPRLTGHYLDYRSLAAEFDVGLADLYPRWLELSRAERGLEEDGLHPRPEVVRRIVVPVLVPLLGRAYGADCEA